MWAWPAGHFVNQRIQQWRKFDVCSMRLGELSGFQVIEGKAKKVTTPKTKILTVYRFCQTKSL